MIKLNKICTTKYLLTVTGHPEEVACQVNILNNFGVISFTTTHDFRSSGGIPVDYREGEDGEVTLNSYRERFLQGMLAMAGSQMTRPGKGFMRVKKFVNAHKMRLAARTARLIRTMFEIE